MALMISYFNTRELIPKIVALYKAEPIASRVAKPMIMLSSIARPLVIILSASNDVLLRLITEGSTRNVKDFCRS